MKNLVDFVVGGIILTGWIIISENLRIRRNRRMGR